MKRWCLLVLVIAVIASANSPAIAGNVSFGIEAGLMMTSITENPTSWEPTKSFKPGISAGAFLIYRFNDRFSLRPELLYAQRGVQSQLYDGFVSVDLTAKFDYLELPLLAVYTFPLKSKIKPRIFAGPVVGYVLNSELEMSASILSVSVDFSSVTHVNDFALLLGAGFDWEVNDGIITFDVRYQRGFSNVIVTGDFEINGDPETIEADDVKNHGLAFMLGYVF
jgi:outer membrane protein W